MSIINKTVTEPKSTVTMSVIADGAITIVGVPVLIYKSSTGYKAKVDAVTNATNMVGRTLGITTASAATGTVTQVIVGGKAAVAASAGTIGQMITAITSAGSCSTAAFSSVASTGNIYGYYSASKEVVLVG